MDTTGDRRAAQLLEFIDASPSPWHAGASMAQILERAGFVPLREGDAWDIQPGGRYYVTRDHSTIAAFVIGTGSLLKDGFRIIGAHTDSPGFRVKPAGSRIRNRHHGLDVEIYGGPILATFADRDLTLAGRVSIRDGDTGDARTALFHANRPLVRFPNAAIHLNRQVNQEGLKYQAHDELTLIQGLAREGLPEGPTLQELIATDLDVAPEQVLAWELAVADTQAGAFFGERNEFVANSQLDNLGSCHAGLCAIMDADPDSFGGVAVLACFDHEEVGSQSYKGAQGTFLPELLSRITGAQGIGEQDRPRVLARSMVLSADMAHAYHPAFTSLYDSDNAATVNGGPVIKVNAQQRYATDAGAEAVFMVLCDEAGVTCQKYIHRNDIPCGSTIGPITGAGLGVRTVDVGNPMWSMHSIRESAGAQDHGAMIDVMHHYYCRASLPWREAP
ncbi:M18 family aminopeptidase [Aquisalimonas sp. 2447]|uniref:M18 family aminopeptidase n=1 Tax=Aquisalimonas sp. 2447 TaxID=2740807 RepID=UPI00143260EE|nr:M18 family aminopeptidase [Aquisalimonas sp. 2447]QIT54052.1 M18 family aminopeptidase [Aquisalimonas sp. 2447]